MLLSLTAGTASAASSLCGTRPIRLAFFDYGLYYSHGEGIDKDLVDALQKRSGCRFDIQVQARARTWEELRTGALDMATSALETPERDGFGWFEPYLRIKNLVVLPDDVGQSVKSADDFLAQPKLVLGVVRGFKHGEDYDRWIDQLRRDNRVVEYVDADLLFRNLAAHRVDGAIADPLVYHLLLEPSQLARMTIEDWIPSQPGDPVNLVFSKARFDRAAIEEWRGLIRELIADGTMAAIFRRYLPEAEADRVMRRK
ncbi:MAG TPA: transporter substrate-binding domain-containing protein [Magnetospirillaceae bacterium]|nr:transporter substrate-binding domain-containing protein [Magnetospirillaceae bacterium]